MSCDAWRDALSASADGEDPGIDRRLLDAHLARCPACRAFAEDAHDLGRAYALEEAPAMPDLSARVSRLDRIADRASRWGLVRALLAVVAVQVLVLSIPGLVLGDEPSTSEHGARHLGAFSAAYAAGLLLVVWRPARARSLLPVAATLAAALLITAAVDVAEGRVPLVDEVVHLPELVSVLLVWLLAVPPPRPAARRRAPSVAGRLRAVGAADGPDAEDGAGAAELRRAGVAAGGPA
jgi:predicted anti-sigma-YlaC factor YlaD